LGITYNDIGHYDEAIPEFTKSIELLEKWGKEYVKDNSLWEGLGRAYHKTGQYNKEKKIYKKSEKYIPDNTLIIFRQAILSFAEKDAVMANTYIQKFISIHITGNHFHSNLEIRKG
jgi:tetratricopeptide (TPR) repeat protein